VKNKEWRVEKGRKIFFRPLMVRNSIPKKNASQFSNPTRGGDAFISIFVLIKRID